MTEPLDEDRTRLVTVTCPGCFHPREWDASAVCPFCRYRPNADRSGALLPVGTQLKRYVIGEKLGQGGFGITYRGFDLKLHMKVAIKEYYPSDSVGRSTDRKTVVLNSREHEELFGYGLKTFLKEARTLAQMKHPHLVRVLNYFEMNGTAYLVMDYLEGEDLATHLKRQPGGRLPWRLAINLILPVLDGLRKVHEAGFMHRDIKPGNLYRTDEGLVLLDFGSARQVADSHTRSLLIFTRGYAPYEQYLAGHLNRQGPWTDVYGMAATLYFMLTAQCPPSALDRKQHDLLQQPDLLRSARHFVPDLPPALDAALGAALALEPERRLQSVVEFKQGLEAVLAEEERVVQVPLEPVVQAPVDPLVQAPVDPLVQVPLAPVVQSPVESVVQVPLAPVVQVPLAPVVQSPVESVIQSRVEPVVEAPLEPVIQAPLEPSVNRGRPARPSRRWQVAVIALGLIGLVWGGAWIGFRSPPRQPDLPVAPIALPPVVETPPVPVVETPVTVTPPVVETPPIAEKTPVTETPSVVEKMPVAEAPPVAEASQSFEPEMVRIPGGCFQMGSPVSEKERGEDERQHRVCVEAFEIAKHEVTVGEFKRFTSATGYRTDAERNTREKGCYAWSAISGKWGWREGVDWQKPGYEQSDAHPVVCVSWNDAVAYAAWLSKQTGRTYRLPIEAEWEYAARAGTTSARYWGDNPDQACRYANVADRTEGRGGHSWPVRHDCADHYWYAASVGSFQANAWNLSDLLGNAWEWTCSAYDKKYGGAEMKCVENNTADTLVVRGGSWFYRPAWARAANRDTNTTWRRHLDGGFRLVRSL